MGVIPDPASVEDEWIPAIRIAQSAWFLRGHEYVSGVPVVRWFRRIAADEDWFAKEFHPAVPRVVPSLIVESSETIDGLRDYHTAAGNPIECDGSGVSFWFTLRAICSSFSTLTVASACSRYRWWILPFVFSTCDGAAIRSVDFESGDVANFMDAGRGFLSSARGTRASFLSLCFWIDVGAIICLCCFALYKMWKMRDRRMKWCGPSMDDGEAGSLGIPNGTPAAGNLISPICISRPIMMPEVPPPAGVGAFFGPPDVSVVVSHRSSLLEPDDEGDGAFSSISGRRRCLAAVRPPSTVTKCCARKISPPDGTSRPLVAHPCLAEDGMSNLPLGDEVARVGDSPNRTPGTGGCAYL